MVASSSLSAGLAGRTLTLHLENGWLIEHRFQSATVLTRTIRDIGPVGQFPSDAGTVIYSATEIRPGFFFVNFVEPGLRASTVTLLLDLDRRICTVVLGQLPGQTETARPVRDRVARRAELNEIGATFIHGAIDAPFAAVSLRHTPTSDLVGMLLQSVDRRNS